MRTRYSLQGSRRQPGRICSVVAILLTSTLGRAVAADLPCCAETEIEYLNQEFRLAGVLLQPLAEGAFPAAVILQGSGASDRSNAWARLVAETLVQKGMATLLTDKRGSGRSRGDWRTASFEDLARDALAGVAAIRDRPGIRSDLVGLVGLSQGGHVAPLAATLGEVAFVVDLVGGALPMKETFFHELEQTYRQHGLSEPQIEDLQRLTALSFVFVETGEGFDEYLAHREHLTGVFGPQATQTWPDTPEDPYWIFWRGIHDFDPLPFWREVVDVRGLPAFIGYGELDEHDNVPVAASVARLERELEGRSLTLEVYAGVGHSLMAGGALAPELLGDLEGFVGQIAGSGPQRRRIP